jgi:hypothetical protein
MAESEAEWQKLFDDYILSILLKNKSLRKIRKS